MRHATVTIPVPARLDWKALGYIVSIVSVFFLGAAAWLKQNPPWWYHLAVIVGMATSIIGMAFRYKAHLDEKHEIRKAEAKADHADGRITSAKFKRSPPK